MLETIINLEKMHHKYAKIFNGDIALMVQTVDLFMAMQTMMVEDDLPILSKTIQVAQ